MHMSFYQGEMLRQWWTSKETNPSLVEACTKPITLGYLQGISYAIKEGVPIRT